MSFASRRKLAGISQKAVAEKIGVNQSTVCLWETGKTQPRVFLLPKLAKLYGCTVDELLAEDEVNTDQANNQKGDTE